MSKEVKEIDENLYRFIRENNIPVVQIEKERKYWLVRTQAGDFYDQFYFDNFIAIGWDDFNEIDRFKSTDKSILIKEIETAYPDKSKPGLIYGQIHRFLFELSPGDIVMIPSPNSTHISFGVIKSDTYIAEVKENDIEEGACPFQKRRDVEWIKTVARTDLDPYLYKMMHTHVTISNASDYDEVIDRTLHSFYLKDGRAHLVLQVKQEQDIAAMDLINGINNILDLVPFLENPENPEISFDKRDIDLKLRVQSPGVMEFISDVAPWAVLGMGILLNYVVGGNIKATFTKEQTDVDASSQGLLEKILKFKKHNDAQKLKELEIKSKETVEALKLQMPEETKNLPEQPLVRED